MAHQPIAYSDSGAGEPVLLLHCSCSSSSQWESLREALDQAFRVVATDQWGCGESEPWTGQGQFSLQQEAVQVISIIRDIGSAVHLVGHSYGGAVALRVAREQAERILSLTLVEPTAFHILRDGTARNQALFEEISSVAEVVRQALLSGDYWRGMAGFIDYWNGEGAWDAISENGRSKLAQTAQKVVLDFHALFEEPALLKEYAALSIPTLLLYGDRSPAPTRRIAEMLGTAMPRARKLQIQGAGHMMPLTHGDSINLEIASHLQCHQTGTNRPVA